MTNTDFIKAILAKNPRYNVQEIKDANIPKIII